nr:unnamed protein product [Callosobruchus analis]
MERLDFALIQEPGVSNEGRISGLENCPGKLVSCSSTKKPRACLITRKNIKLFVLTGYCTQDVVAAQISVPEETSKRDTVICSAYFLGETVQAVRDLITYCRRNNKQLVLGCDANAHYMDWESSDINTRGEQLYNYIIGEGLMVNSIGSEPTFVTINRQEGLDLTISTRFISTDIVNWTVSSEPLCSDHRHIWFDIRSNMPSLLQYRDPKNTDWEGFAKSLQLRMGNMLMNIRDRAEIEVASD